MNESIRLRMEYQYSRTVNENNVMAYSYRSDRTFLHTLSRRETKFDSYQPVTHTKKRNVTTNDSYARDSFAQPFDDRRAFGRASRLQVPFETHTPNGRVSLLPSLRVYSYILFPPFSRSDHHWTAMLCIWNTFVRTSFASFNCSIFLALVWRCNHVGYVRRTLARTSFRKFC